MRRTRWAVCLFLIAQMASAAAPSIEAQAQTGLRQELRTKFEADLKKLSDGFDGALGMQFVDLTDGSRIGLNAGLVFPTASTIKVPILIQLFRQEEAKPGLLRDRRVVTADKQTQGSGIVKVFGDGTSALAVEDLSRLMIVLSDNTATNMVIDEVGMDAVNSLVASLGFSTIKLRRKMLQTDAQARGEENVATPAEAAFLMARIAQCELPVSADSCKRIREILEIPQPSHPARDAIPANVPVAFKWGGTEGVGAAWGIVNLPDRPYVFAIMTSYAGNSDSALRGVSETGYRYFSRLARANPYGSRVPLDVIRRQKKEK